MSGLAIDGNEVHGLAIGGQALYPLKKNTSDHSITVDQNEYFRIPTKVTISEGTRIYSALKSGDDFQILNSDQTFTCIGIGKGRVFVTGTAKVDDYSDYNLTNRTGTNDLSNFDEDFPGSIAFSDISNFTYGGVISPLSHIGRALRSLLKEVTAWA